MTRVVSGQLSVAGQTAEGWATRVIHRPLATGHWPLCLTLLVTLLALAVPAAGQDRLDHRVSLDLKAMAPRDAFNVIGTAIRYTVEVASDVTTPVDIVVVNVRAKTALDTICDSIGCTWRASGTTIVVSRPASRINVSGRVDPGKNADRHAAIAELRRRMEVPLPADMKFQDASLAEVAERLSKATGLEMTFTVHDPLDRSLRKPASDMTLTVDLSRQTLSKALEAVSTRLEGVLIGIVLGDARDSKGAPSVRILMRSKAVK